MFWTNSTSCIANLRASGLFCSISLFMAGWLAFFSAGEALAQDTKFHLKEVHIVQPYTGPDAESVLLRGLTHTGKKIQLRLNGVGALANGAQVRADCVRLPVLAMLDDKYAVEVYLTGPTVTGGVRDARLYTNAIVNLVAGNSVSCMLVNKNKFDYGAPGVSWYDLP